MEHVYVNASGNGMTNEQLWAASLRISVVALWRADNEFPIGALRFWSNVQSPGRAPSGIHYGASRRNGYPASSTTHWPARSSAISDNVSSRSGNIKSGSGSS